MVARTQVRMAEMTAQIDQSSLAEARQALAEAQQAEAAIAAELETRLQVCYQPILKRVHF